MYKGSENQCQIILVLWKRGVQQSQVEQLNCAKKH